ncbi:hypothetical protein YN1_7850 [Nanoarchaeota archaeon]
MRDLSSENISIRASYGIIYTFLYNNRKNNIAYSTKVDKINIVRDDKNLKLFSDDFPENKQKYRYKIIIEIKNFNYSKLEKPSSISFINPLDSTEIVYFTDFRLYNLLEYLYHGKLSLTLIRENSKNIEFRIEILPYVRMTKDLKTILNDLNVPIDSIQEDGVDISNLKINNNTTLKFITRGIDGIIDYYIAKNKGRGILAISSNIIKEYAGYKLYDIGRRYEEGKPLLLLANVFTPKYNNLVDYLPHIIKEIDREGNVYTIQPTGEERKIRNYLVENMITKDPLYFIRPDN